MINRYGRAGLVLFAAALYGGPVLAGLAGHGARTLPVFAALFLLYLAVARKPDLSTGTGRAGLVLMAAVQVVLVGLAWGIGLGAAQFLGPVMLPLWAPLAITGVAAGVGAWAWRDAAEMDVMLEHAIHEIEAMQAPCISPAAPPWPEVSARAQTAYDRFRAELARVEAVSVSWIDPLVQRLEGEAGVEAFELLYDDAGIEGDGTNPALDFALLRFVAAPPVQYALIERGEGGFAPSLLLNASDASVRAEARARVIDLIDAGAPQEQLPDRTWLAELDAEFPGEGYGTLLNDARAPQGA